MRSLALKLTLAFLLIGLTGALLVALLLGQRTRSEFDRFVSNQDQTILIPVLGEYYATHGSWDGLEYALESDHTFAVRSRGLTVFDNAGMVVLGNRRYHAGERIPDRLINNSTPITANGNTVGYALFAPPEFNDPDPDHLPPEITFLQSLTWATAISAVIAVVIALFLGSLLAQTLTRPIRELTAATKRMASGRLDQQVKVHSHDEIGELATAFNHMSADLSRASQLRKQMTADIAHDLRTPLSIVRGYTEGLKEGRLQGSTEIYAVMHQEVEHLQHLVEDLRMLSLADAGELPLNRRIIDPTALLERTGLAYVVQAEEQGIALRVETPECLPSITVDTDRMTQVLNNLVSNALRYTSQGTIVLSAAAVNQHVNLSVCDTGTGIAPADLPFVFDRFYRADKSRHRTDGNSSGLGLAIAKAIVEAHDGVIAVASTPGKGTTFTITLPAVQRKG